MIETSREARERIVQDLIQRIRDGELEIDERLPAVAELAKAYETTPSRIRAALNQMRDRGFIVTRPRSGTFVAEPQIPYTIDSVNHFADNMRKSGRDPGSRLLSCQRMKPPSDIAYHLRIPQRQMVFCSQFLRLANSVPIALHRSYVPADRFERIPDLIESGMTMIDALRRVGIRNVLRTQTMVSSRPMTRDERANLKSDKTDVGLIVQSVNADETDEPIQVGNTVFPSSRVTLRIPTL